jgi:hypothetical protein
MNDGGPRSFEREWMSHDIWPKTKKAVAVGAIVAACVGVAAASCTRADPCNTGHPEAGVCP